MNYFKLLFLRLFNFIFRNCSRTILNDFMNNNRLDDCLVDNDKKTWTPGKLLEDLN
jgi:hypothetical protein